jgi:RNA polymerase sigma-70 factor (ECF subfamily)
MRPVWAGRRSLPAADAEAERREEIEEVRRALADLPEAQRDVVQRRVYGDQTFATIAAELKCPLGTVLTRMRLALKNLARLLETEQ